MEIIIVGCGRLGSEVAYRLYQEGHDVAVVEHDPKAFDKLPADFMGRTYDGNALNKNVLDRAGIETADVLVAVTNDDAVNLVVGHIAKDIYHVSQVVARNFDPKLSSYYDVFKIDVVSSTKWGAQRTIDLIMNPELPLVYSAINGQVNIYQINAPASWIDKPVKDTLLNYPCNMVAIQRGENTFVPKDSEILENGDVILVSAEKEDFKLLQQDAAFSKEEK